LNSAGKYSATLAVLIVFLIASMCDLMVSCLLVMAAYSQRPNLARPWLVVFMVSLTIDVVVFISSVTNGDLAVAITTPIRIGDSRFVITFFFKRMIDKHLRIIFEM
jgi:hypothetical protein